MSTHHAIEEEYSKLSTYAKWVGIHNATEWHDYHREKGCPSWVPEDPEAHFGSLGQWQDWDHFLN